MLPLYAKNTIDWEKLFESSASAHAGLLFDKFPQGSGWAERGRQFKPDDGVKKDFLGKIVTKYQNVHFQEVAKAHLKTALDRQRELVSILQGDSIAVTTDWRFVSGLGASHPFETGFIWHRTLSVPYLPGSSVKGLMRAWAKHWGGLEDHNEIARLFGPDNFGSDKPIDGMAGCGALIVFDALPSKLPKLETDILNPHYSDYYNDPKNPPADYISPVPVFFLTVAAMQCFEFFIAPRPDKKNDPAQQQCDVATGLMLLQQALEILGVGGKTAVGYGVFNESIESKQARKKKQAKVEEECEELIRIAIIDKLAHDKGYCGLAADIFKKSQLDNWANKDKNAQKFYQEMKEDFLQRIEQETDSQIKKDAIAIVVNILEKEYSNFGIMAKPEDRKGKKNDYVYKENPRNIAIRLNELLKSIIE